MSYQQKYLKYKSKYLALKSQPNNNTNANIKTNSFISNLVQLGGSKSIFSNDSLIENLTATPSLSDIWGGSYKNKSSDINNLVKLLTESEDIITTEFSLEGGSESIPSTASDDKSSDSEEINDSEESEEMKMSESEENKKPKPKIEESDSESKKKSDSDSDSESKKKSDSDSDSESKKKSDSDSEEPESEQFGGQNKPKKPNSYKKFFFEDSDIVSSTTTSDSDLSSFNTSTTDDSDLSL